MTFKSKLEAAVENAEILEAALKQDIEHWLKEFASGNQEQISRRAFVRAVFAFIEGTVFGLKRMSLEMCIEEDIVIPPEEFVLLSEQGAELSEKGEVNQRSAMIRFKPNLRFAFRKFAEISHAKFVLDAGGTGWQALLESTKIRDRLMHPKSSDQVNVTDDELQVVKKAYEWFTLSYSQLFAAAILAMDEENAERQKEVERLEKRLRELESQPRLKNL